MVVLEVVMIASVLPLSTTECPGCAAQQKCWPVQRDRGNAGRYETGLPVMDLVVFAEYSGF
jgi:hypothetical protein